MAEIHIESQPFIDPNFYNRGLSVEFHAENINNLPIQEQRNLGIMVFGILCEKCPYYKSGKCTSFGPEDGWGPQMPWQVVTEDKKNILSDAIGFTAEIFLDPNNIDAAQLRLPCNDTEVDVDMDSLASKSMV